MPGEDELAGAGGRVTIGRMPRPQRLALALCLMILPTIPATAPGQQPASPMAPQPASRPDRTKLRGACDALLQLAVRKPYGIGWGGPDGTPAAGKARLQPVSLRPLHTPAAGCVLLWASQELNEPRFGQAAIDAARGVAAAQTRSGQLPAQALFGPTAGGRDAPAAVPDRAASRAGLVLLLTVIDQGDVEPSQSELLRRSAARAAFWLTKQQQPNGAWPSAEPAGAAPGEAQRIVRLDGPDYRDSTIALLLAADVLQDKPPSLAARRAIEHLVQVRLEQPERSKGLWPAAQTITGGTLEGPDRPPGANLLASRYALDLLLADHLLTGDARSGDLLRETAQTLARLRRPDGKWDRHPEAPVDPTVPGPFEPPIEPTDDATAVARGATVADFGLSKRLRAVEVLQRLGRELYLQGLTRKASLRKRLAMVLLGLSEDALVSTEAEPRLAAAAGSEELEARVRHLFDLLER